MNCTCSIVTSAWSLAVLLLAPTFTQAGENLIANPGFEEAVAGKNLPAKWSANPPAFSLAAGQGRNGSNGLKYVNVRRARRAGLSPR